MWRTVLVPCIIGTCTLLPSARTKSWSTVPEGSKGSSHAAAKYTVLRSDSVVPAPTSMGAFVILPPVSADTQSSIRAGVDGSAKSTGWTPAP